MENDKVLEYAREYKEMMDSFNDCGWWTRSNDPNVNIIVDSQIKKIVEAIKPENYAVRKFFVDEICDFMNEVDYGNGTRLNRVIFDEIIWPVFLTEYKNNNAKYIKWIAQCDNFIRHERLKQLDVSDLDVCGIEYFEYFCGKSFMIDKDYKTLNMLMEWELIDYLILRDEEYSDWVCDPKRYSELIKPFSERFERCREYCRISGNNEWDHFIDIWGLLVTHLYKYEEYVRKNGNIKFDKYLKKIGVKIKLGDHV